MSRRERWGCCSWRSWRCNAAEELPTFPATAECAPLRRAPQAPGQAHLGRGLPGQDRVRGQGRHQRRDGAPPGGRQGAAGPQGQVGAQVQGARGRPACCPAFSGASACPGGGWGGCFGGGREGCPRLSMPPPHTHTHTPKKQIYTPTKRLAYQEYIETIMDAKVGACFPPGCRPVQFSSPQRRARMGHPATAAHTRCPPPPKKMLVIIKTQHPAPPPPPPRADRALPLGLGRVVPQGL